MAILGEEGGRDGDFEVGDSGVSRGSIAEEGEGFSLKPFFFFSKL